MDEEWALTQLQGFIELTRLVQPQSGGGVVYMGDFASPVGSKADIIATAQVVGLLQVWLTRSFRPRVRPVG